jgi:hypothetical protein
LRVSLLLVDALAAVPIVFKSKFICGVAVRIVEQDSLKRDVKHDHLNFDLIPNMQRHFTDCLFKLFK